jgi:hypothetical protein
MVLAEVEPTPPFGHSSWEGIFPEIISHQAAPVVTLRGEVGQNPLLGAAFLFWGNPRIKKRQDRGGAERRGGFHLR